MNLEVSDGFSGLKVSNVRKSYNSRLVLRDISLNLRQREIVALLGANGTGKTTCFYTIAGLTSSDSGTITLNGTNISNMPIYKRANLGLSYLPQEPSIFKGMTVEDNIASVLEISTKDRLVRRVKLESLLESFSLTNIRKAKAITLSGGERRRVEIARNLATYPKYLLLDEPFAGVDPIAVDEIRSLIKGLKNRGIGILITDHNVRETLKLVDRVYIINDGSIIKSGSPAEIVSDNTVKSVYLGASFNL